MKRLAAFCDGTWASLSRTPVEMKAHGAETNVALLYRVAANADPSQEAAYFSGVGVSRFPLLGGAIGAGLNDKITEVYRWICARYAFGDAVHLFGFSRGAYTARSVAGLIRHTGFLRNPCRDTAAEAMRLYRRHRDPDADPLRRFRLAHAVAFVSDDGAGPRLIEARTGREAPHAVAFIGVWDTVGALGAPRAFPFARLLNRRFEFHDTALSRATARAAQALACDERRTLFEPSTWSNLEALNAGLATPAYVQAWFPGDHGSVGGGGLDRRLSDGALLWMAQEARKAGLTIDGRHPILAAARARQDAIGGPLTNAADDTFARIGRRRDRPAMGAADVAHAGALARMAADAGYRPAPLKRLWPKQDPPRGTGREV